MCRVLSGEKTGFKPRKCPVEVPLTGGRIGRQMRLGVLSRGHEIASGGRPVSRSSKYSVDEPPDHSFDEDANGMAQPFDETALLVARFRIFLMATHAHTLELGL